MRKTGIVFVQVLNSQKTKNLFGLIFRELKGQFLSFCVPQKMEFKACPIHCLSEMCDGFWKEWSFAENKIRNSLFFKNTKTKKFINFLFDLFPPPPQKRGNKMSSLKEAYFTPTSVSVWDAREEGVKHLQWTALNALLFLFRVLQICHPSNVGVENGLRIRGV